MEKFTQGEWQNDNYSIVVPVKDMPAELEIAKVTVFNEGRANAHLIAAAPEMYQSTKDANRALKKLIETMEVMELELDNEQLKLVCRMDVQAMRNMVLKNDGLLAKARGDHA